MDDTNKISNVKSQMSNALGQTMPATQTPASDVAQTVASPAPIAPVSTPHKEMGPVNTQEYIKPSEIEPTIPLEVAEHGVEAVVNQEAPSLPEEVKQAGVEPAKESTPIATQPQGTVHLPMTIQEAKQTVKFHKKIGDSLYWLATLILKQAKVMHKKINAQE